MTASGMKTGYRHLVVFGLFLFIAVPALANAGTLLMWAGMGHLLWGNAIIGLLEALFLARVFDVRFHLAVPLIILGNYLSMFGGLILIMAFQPNPSVYDLLLGDAPLYRLPLLIGVMIAITFSFSVLFEWPFFRMAFRREREMDISEGYDIDERLYGWRHSFKATVITQVASYLLLAIYYLAVSGTGFVRNARVTHGLEFVEQPKAIVYFLRDGQNYRVRLNGTTPVKVAQGEEEKVIAIYLASNYEDAGNLYRAINSGTGGPAFDLRLPKERKWRGRTDFWGTTGLELTNVQTDERFDLGLELPFIRWRSTCATMLPGDQVVYQFGPQIVLFDIKTRKIAFIAKGSRPVVVLE